jgi:hypothetical protein
MMRALLMIGVLLGAALPTTALPGFSADAQVRLNRGRAVASARPSINRPAARPARPQINGGGNRNWNGGNRPNRPGRPDVVVINRPGGGYYDGGRYYDRDRWHDDRGDNFLEFVGKTAAITAGVSAVSAVIGSIVRDKPDQCAEPNAYGQIYCNGVWYQAVANNGGYQVVAPPQQQVMQQPMQQPMPPQMPPPPQ